MEKSNTFEDQFKLSYHAYVRQEQRNITDNSIDEVMQSGEQLDCKNTKIYTNENVKIVVAKGSNTIITVNKNTRNTRFLLSELTREKEKSLLYKANVRRNDHAMIELAELYLNGELGQKDVRKAYSLFKRAAEKGNSHAMCRIAAFYELGYLGEPNTELADKWMKKAADYNNTYALALTGQKLLCKYLEKYPIGSNLFRPSAPKNEILYYLNKAADKGSSRAIFQIAQIFEEGLLGTQDLSKAQEFYVKAGKTGSPASLDSLYKMCLKGSFSAKEFEEILDNLSSLLIKNSIGMGYQQGTDQLNGNLGYNPVRGFKMIEQIAFKEHEASIKTLAKCYCYGIECEVDLKLAQYWFMKLYELYDISVKAGNVISIWKLGHLYLKGSVGKIDLMKAELCFKEAIEKSSNPDWIYRVGQLYWEGRLGDKPTNIGFQLITQAINMWKLKAAQGDVTAHNDLGNAYKYINSFKNSVYWLSQSNKKIDNLLDLACIYLDDSLPEKNSPLGLKILEMIILEHDVAASVAFKRLDFTINHETVRWLHEKANSIRQPLPGKNSNEYIFQSFIINMLARVYEFGQLDAIDYEIACKYYHQLFIDFKSVNAGNKLIGFYIDQRLPTEYHDTAKNWALQLPVLVETDKINLRVFKDCVLLICKIYKHGNILSYNIKESTKWLYLALYWTHEIDKRKEIEHDLKILPQLDYQQKEQIVCELAQMTSSMQSKFKIMSRILGDIFNDNKIINRNIDKAINWYTESSLKNNSKASLALARIYRHDKQDIDESVKWYMLSIQQGNKSALDELTSIAGEHKLDLTSFLNKYKHKSLVEESELINVKPFKHLESYPKTTKQMSDLGKYYLDLDGDQDMKILNAAFWFRKAMDKGSIDAAVELYSMYKSGILGINLVPVADHYLYPDILDTCYRRLKYVTENAILQNQNTSSILSILKSISAVFKIRSSTNELHGKVEELVNKTQNISTKMLKDILSDLIILLQQEYSSDTIEGAISDVFDKINVLEEETQSTSWAFNSTDTVESSLGIQNML